MTKVFINKFTLWLFLLAFIAAPAAYARQVQPVLTAPAALALNETAFEKQKLKDCEPFIRTELFFGRNKPDGTEVSEEEFADFLNVTITPEFPDGLTVLSGIGQFRDSEGRIIQEKAKVLILLYPSNTRKASSRKIELIRDAYKTRFQQQSVLRVDDVLPACVSF